MDNAYDSGNNASATSSSDDTLSVMHQHAIGLWGYVQASMYFQKNPDTQYEEKDMIESSKDKDDPPLLPRGGSIRFLRRKSLEAGNACSYSNG